VHIARGLQVTASSDARRPLKAGDPTGIVDANASDKTASGHSAISARGAFCIERG
jgi:hypothetical protein